MVCCHYSLPFLELITAAATLCKKAILQEGKTDFLEDDIKPPPILSWIRTPTKVAYISNCLLEANYNRF